MSDEKDSEHKYDWKQLHSPVTVSDPPRWMLGAIEDAGRHADHDMNLAVYGGTHGPECVYCKRNEAERKWRLEHPDDCEDWD